MAGCQVLLGSSDLAARGHWHHAVSVLLDSQRELPNALLHGWPDWHSITEQSFKSAGVYSPCHRVLCGGPDVKSPVAAMVNAKPADVLGLAGAADAFQVNFLFQRTPLAARPLPR
jgi:hypothetical protein